MRKLLFAALGAMALLAVSVGQPPEARAQDTMPILTGELWQQMRQDQKLAFLWGFVHFIEYERGLLAIAPEDDDWSYMPAIIKVFQTKTYNDIVYEIDGYYAQNPDNLDQPVVETIMRAVVIPGL